MVKMMRWEMKRKPRLIATLSRLRPGVFNAVDDPRLLVLPDEQTHFEPATRSDTGPRLSYMLFALTLFRRLYKIPLIGIKADILVA